MILKKHFNHLIILLLFCSHSVYGSSVIDADNAYKSGDFNTAFELYSAIIKESKPDASADMYYNYGNAAYKLQEYAEAVWGYRSAILRNPRLDDAYVNLELTQAYLVDPLTEESKPKITGLESIVISIPKIVLSYIVTVTAILAAVFCLIFGLQKSLKLRKRFFAFGICFLVIAFCTYGLYFFRDSIIQHSAVAVVMQPNVALSSSPGNGKQAFMLHAGACVIILQTQDTYTEVEYAGKKAWIESSEIRSIE